jgi:Ion channel
MSRAWRRPSAVLLAVQLLSILIYPFMDSSTLGRALFSTFAIVVLFLAVRTVQASPALTWIAVLIGVPIVVLTILEVVYPQNATVILWSSILHAAFYVYTTVALLRYMFHDSAGTSDELWAAGATFTVLAWAFAYVYLAVQIIWPGSFTGTGTSTDPQAWFEMLFLSFTNLTSVGVSDILPVSAYARSWMMLEQFAGVLYIALVVSRVVQLTVVRQRAREAAARTTARPVSDADHAAVSPPLEG